MDTKSFRIKPSHGSPGLYLQSSPAVPSLSFFIHSFHNALSLLTIMRFIFTTALFFLVSLLQRESLLVAERHRVDRHLYVVVANMTVAAPLPPHAGMGFLRRLELSSFWNRMCFSACRGALIPVSSHSYSHTVGLLTEMTRRSGVLSGSLGTRLSPRLILRPSSPPPPYPESNWRLRLPPLLPSSEEVHTITFYAGQSLSDHSFILVFVFIACYSSFRRLFATFFFASSMWRMLFETVVLFELSAP